jgi:serine/threonine protein kinase
MSPEQALGQAVDARADLYSVGVILFEMFTGQCPFGGGAVTVLRQHLIGEVPALPPAVTAGIDPRIGAILRRLLAKVPENRFASAADLLVALDECSNERVLLAPPGRSRPMRRMVTVVIAVVATAIAILVVAGRTRAPTSTAAPVSPESAVVVVPANSSPVPPSTPTESVEVAPMSILPPPPAPSSSTAAAGTQPSSGGRPAASRGRSRQTGPGGIYIPPPSQWFK